jgi:Pyruvate/2-oxoacid:ferredoxin oxidoreductase delta subunit
VVGLTVTDECTACGACLLTCPEHAFIPTIPLTVNDRCTGCGECVEICPRDALVLS